MDIGERLLALRNARGWTFEELSQKTGYSAIMIRRVEEQGLLPNIRFLRTIAAAYSLTLAGFFEVIPKQIRKEDELTFQRLQFILDEARRLDADDKQKSRAVSIKENVEEFYYRALSHNAPIRRRKKAQPDKSAAKAKKHGTFPETANVKSSTT